ncbi:MAG: hypothetical protein HC904_15685 [Blastochloris sp.]|nr:hypothetical protein [Blastochloris sp.]
MEKTSASPAAMQSFYEQWIQQFSKNRDMKVEAQTRLLSLLQKKSDPGAEKLQQDIVREIVGNVLILASKPGRVRFLNSSKPKIGTRQKRSSNASSASSTTRAGAIFSIR